jgi:hypothetical protein
MSPSIHLDTAEDMAIESGQRLPWPPKSNLAGWEDPTFSPR